MIKKARLGFSTNSHCKSELAGNTDGFIFFPFFLAGGAHRQKAESLFLEGEVRLAPETGLRPSDRLACALGLWVLMSAASSLHPEAVPMPPSSCWQRGFGGWNLWLKPQVLLPPGGSKRQAMKRPGRDAGQPAWLYRGGGGAASEGTSTGQTTRSARPARSARASAPHPRWHPRSSFDCEP